MDATPAAQPRRILFLDDDPDRAHRFLADHPEAIWVTTVADCVDRLDGPEPWDEIHLDHDLGGERFVATHRDDCGMEVVRWLCREPRPHLAGSRFYIHSWNEDAAFAMQLQLSMSGYRVDLRPFGAAEAEAASASPPIIVRPGWLSRGLRRLIRLVPGLRAVRRPPSSAVATASGQDVGPTIEPHTESESSR